MTDLRLNANIIILNKCQLIILKIVKDTIIWS